MNNIKQFLLCYLCILGEKKSAYNNFFACLIYTSNLMAEVVLFITIIATSEIMKIYRQRNLISDRKDDNIE